MVTTRSQGPADQSPQIQALPDAPARKKRKAANTPAEPTRKAEDRPKAVKQPVHTTEASAKQAALPQEDQEARVHTAPPQDESELPEHVIAALLEAQKRKQQAAQAAPAQTTQRASPRKRAATAHYQLPQPFAVQVLGSQQEHGPSAAALAFRSLHFNSPKHHCSYDMLRPVNSSGARLIAPSITFR